jgi:hypothetical protein
LLPQRYRAEGALPAIGESVRHERAHQTVGARETVHGEHFRFHVSLCHLLLTRKLTPFDGVALGMGEGFD